MLDREVALRPPTGGPRPDDVDPALTSTRSYDPPETYSNACIAAVVEVDAETGQVRIERIVVVEDCGTVLNPMVVEGQVIGAIAQGIGAVLYEELPYDEDGQLPRAGRLSTSSTRRRPRSRRSRSTTSRRRRRSPRAASRAWAKAA